MLGLCCEESMNLKGYYTLGVLIDSEYSVEFLILTPGSNLHGMTMTDMGIIQGNGIALFDYTPDMLTCLVNIIKRL